MVGKKARDSIAAAASPPETSSASSSRDLNGRKDDKDSSLQRDKNMARPSSVYGSWKGKASAVSGTTHVTADNNAISHRPADISHNKVPSVLRSPGKSAPSIQVSTSSENNSQPGTEKVTETTSLNRSVSQQPHPKASDRSGDASSEQGISEERPLPASGWAGWWSRSRQAQKPIDTDRPVQVVDTAVETPRDPKVQQPIVSRSAGSSEVKSDTNTVLQSHGGDPVQDRNSEDNVTKPQRTSWFGLWGPAAKTADESEPRVIGPDPATGNVALDVSKPSNQEGSNETASTPAQTIAGSWAFWSKEKLPQATTTVQQTTGIIEQGELARAGTASQSHPHPVQISTLPIDGIDSTSSTNEPKKESTQSPAKHSENRNKQDVSPQNLQTSSKRASTFDSSTKSGEHLSPETNGLEHSRQPTQNLLLPSFDATYNLAHTPSYWEQLVRLLGRTSAPVQRCLSIASTAPKVRHAVAIGVHGYFPAPILQKLLGPPTGTSIKFANNAAMAIERWAARAGEKCEVERVALEGEGLIANRVDVLWRLLLNWLDHLRKADLIIFACHSQGVPVGVMLAAKLLELGCLASHVRVGLCLMAGVNLGPFANLYQPRLMGTGSSIAELFDFGRPSSQVYEKYLAALETTLKHDVRVLYVGSIDDQLVSLESSTHSTVSHPYIFRAVFVDGRVHAPDFISHLVGFALKLRNLGVSDHGLIRELSTPLAGSLYGGEGHSRIYEDSAVYDLAIQHTLETTNLRLQVPITKTVYKEPPNNANPYILPWAMRGMLEEDLVRTEMDAETRKLLTEFEEWKPQSKVLRDVRFRLEAVKSKL